MLTVYGIETLIIEYTYKVSSTVATVLTVYGIETYYPFLNPRKIFRLQQCLPFTVLKPNKYVPSSYSGRPVATVLTVYGIETSHSEARYQDEYVATVLTVYGIETINFNFMRC